MSFHNKDPPNDIYCITEKPSKHYFTEKFHTLVNDANDGIISTPRIKAFMDQFIGCPIDEKSQEIIDRIINSEGGKAVIHYIAVYRKKTGDDVKEEKIETQYREFLKDLIYCWADGRCTFG